MDNIEPKVKAERLQSGVLKREATMLKSMVKDYCKRHHGGDTLCEDCREFLVYALTRLACCPFGEQKPTCLKCKIHCSRAEDKEQAHQIMRADGPSMPLKHTLLTIVHLLKNTKCEPDKPITT